MNEPVRTMLKAPVSYCHCGEPNGQHTTIRDLLASTGILMRDAEIIRQDCGDAALQHKLEGRIEELSNALKHLGDLDQRVCTYGWDPSLDTAHKPGCAGGPYPPR